MEGELGMSNTDKEKIIKDLSWPPEIKELGDAAELTKGNAAGSQIDVGPVFNRSTIIYS
jgi:hypothetical protein